MRKLNLSVEALQVESFETAAIGADVRGTVAGHMPKPGPGPIVETYYAGNTCECTLAQSCAGTCPIDCLRLTVDTCETFTVDTCPA